MEDADHAGSYTDAYQEAKSLYQKIGAAWCPVLGSHVIFNRKGMLRPKSEQKRRFSLLKYAKNILEDPKTKFSYEERISNDMHLFFWGFTIERDGIFIELVVRQVGKGKKHFFSIYGAKQKSPPEGADL